MDAIMFLENLVHFHSDSVALELRGRDVEGYHLPTVKTVLIWVSSLPLKLRSSFMPDT